ncbi:MAG TPA: YcxB family protein [Acholeplasma sp.]|nr:YcxB family protein [Acholeplasma sp.]
MKIRYHSFFTEKVAKDFFKFHLGVRSNAKYIYLAFALLMVATGAFLAFGKDKLVVGIVIMVLAPVVLAIRPIQINHTIKKTLLKQSFIGLRYNVIFTEEKIVYQTSKSSKDYSWDDVLLVTETLKYVYYYVSPNAAIVIEKELMDYGERKILREFVLKKFEKEAKFKKYKRV